MMKQMGISVLVCAGCRGVKIPYRSSKAKKNRDTNLIFSLSLIKDVLTGNVISFISHSHVDVYIPKHFLNDNLNTQTYMFNQSYFLFMQIFFPVDHSHFSTKHSYQFGQTFISQVVPVLLKTNLLPISLNSIKMSKPT